MQIKAWLLAVGFLMLGKVVWAENASFTNLQQAVDFIAGALEATNFTCVTEACLNVERKPNEALLKNLQGLNKNRPLRQLYADRAFPTEASAFKLGGHMKELGFIHIDFIQTDGVWKLESIWMCR